MMDTYLTATEVSDLSSFLETLNRERESALTADVTLRDANGELVGYVGWSQSNAEYVFSAEKDVVDDA